MVTSAKIFMMKRFLRFEGGGEFSDNNRFTAPGQYRGIGLGDRHELALRHVGNVVVYG